MQESIDRTSDHGCREFFHVKCDSSSNGFCTLFGEAKLMYARTLSNIDKEGYPMTLQMPAQTGKFRALTIATTMLVFGPTSFVVAQTDVDEDDDTHLIETIIVTAERREENIIEVPLSMTALGEDALEELGLTNFMDIEQVVPGLQFGDENEQKGNGTVIRGIGTFRGGTPIHGGSQVNVDRDLAVSVSVDDVFTFASYGLAPQLFDLERVEVLRGPQGTMRGRNAIAGAVNYYTKKPTDEWDATLQTELTNQFTQRYNVVFGGPVADQLSFRITAGYFQGDGAQENIGLGGDYDAPDQLSISPQLRFKADRVDINLRYLSVRDQGAPRTQIRITEPDRVSRCIGAPLGYEGPLEDENGNCIAGSQNRHYQYTEPFPAIPDNCPVGVPGFMCGDVENVINVNSPGVSDSKRDTWILNVSYDLTDLLELRYSYGKSDVLQKTSRDQDNTNVVAPEQGDFIGGHAGVDSRIHTVFPYDEYSCIHSSTVPLISSPVSFTTKTQTPGRPRSRTLHSVVLVTLAIPSSDLVGVRTRKLPHLESYSLVRFLGSSRLHQLKWLTVRTFTMAF